MTVEMKNQPFHLRFLNAVMGIRAAFESESSFRTHSVFALGAIIFLVGVRPKAIWWALVFLTIAAVLASELINTALEYIADRLHPEPHPMIARAKDCAAAAVLILSLAALGVGGALLWETLSSLAAR